MHRRRVLTATAILLLTALGGCADDAVKAVPFGESDSVACRAVADHWPARVGDLEPRVTAVQSRGVAAWGDPPVVARCGKQPLGPTEDPCIDINGIDWVATTLDDGGTMFTTYGRTPAIEVLVPAAYDSAPLRLPAFTEAASQIEQTLGRCTAATG
ncbi:DUF3515 family protein [Ornithinimicrobium tianjinense]|uniref:DUF3515 domain-containing protein n=1 Tax=Ornithinimicrobium tianjinense TaxID=1195761 RepID=A0A917F764_9MICO|nr:DUF3515 family protein [Ornithinimicrobium tianjinense]GGF50518.1 hypothetical protein GCM10011366_17950 [Ornithinimicrobium tianjinense]